MAVRIRLRRMGRKKKPFYRIIAADQRAPRDGRFIDTLGYYNPLAKPHLIEINEEKALKWLNEGAQPSDTVKSLFSEKGIMHKFSMQKQGKDEAFIATEMEKFDMVKADKSAKAEAAAADKAKKAAEEAKKQQEAEDKARAEAEAAEAAEAAPEATEETAAAPEETPAAEETAAAPEEAPAAEEAAAEETAAAPEEAPVAEEAKKDEKPAE
jgi:small subunit ribosomal protein S16